MVVQHNLRAMNSNRMLGLTSNIQSKSTEKLSSGYKINRAADDAAGLSISEKMRKQIRGLTQASLNAADGISTVQTAEGALNEVQDMLQRMNELAVKAANGTMSTDDRSYIQAEIDQLITEIDRVSETTKFNETYLLKGGSDVTTTNVYNYAEAAEPQLVWGEGMQTESGKFSVEYLNEASTTLSFKGDDKVISVDIAYTDAITEEKKIDWLAPTSNVVNDTTITALVSVSSTAGAAPNTSVYGFSKYDSTTDYYDVNGNKLGDGTGGTINVSTLVTVNSDNGTVTLKPGVEIYSDSVAIPEKLYVTGNGESTEVVSSRTLNK